MPMAGIRSEAGAANPARVRQGCYDEQLLTGFLGSLITRGRGGRKEAACRVMAPVCHTAGKC